MAMLKVKVNIQMFLFIEKISTRGVSFIIVFAGLERLCSAKDHPAWKRRRNDIYRNGM